MAAESYWKLPEAWNRAAAKAGERRKVFCASLADVFEDRPELVGPRKRLFDLILATPHLDWLLLTKRPENVNRMMGPEGVGLYAHANGPVPCPQPNIWIGTSVEDQKTAEERIPHLVRVPAVVRFLSVEPMLGPVDLTVIPAETISDDYVSWGHTPAISWVICGGESGHGARDADLAWFRDLRDQCAHVGVPFFMKQLGKHAVFTAKDGEADTASLEGRIELQSIAAGSPGGSVYKYRWMATHPKGGDWDEWPEDLRVRQFPAVKGFV